MGDVTISKNIKKIGINASVSTIMNTYLKILNTTDSLEKALKMFEKYKINHLPVISNKFPVGIISFTDLRSRIDNKDILLSNAVSEIMTRQVSYISSDTTIKQVAEIFIRESFHALPVVDNSIIVGIVTTTDMIKYFLKQEKIIIPK